mgnify:CR=1 FL=1
MNKFKNGQSVITEIYIEKLKLVKIATKVDPFLDIDRNFRMIEEKINRILEAIND